MVDKDVIDFYIDRTRVRIKEILEKTREKFSERLKFSLSRFIKIDGFNFTNSVFAEFCNITKIKPSELVFKDYTILTTNPGRNLEIYWNTYYAKRRVTSYTQDPIKQINNFQVLVETCLNYNIDIDDLFIILEEKKSVESRTSLIPKNKEYIKVDPSSTYKEILDRFKKIIYSKGISVTKFINSKNGRVLKTIYLGTYLCIIPTVNTIARACDALEIKPSELLSKNFDETKLDYGYKVKWNYNKIDEIVKKLGVTKRQLLPIANIKTKNLSLDSIISMSTTFDICIDNFFEITKKEG